MTPGIGAGPPVKPTVLLRPGRDEDAAAFIGLIGDAWSEYPNCVMDVDGENPELRHLATHFAAQGGALWAAERDGETVGMIGVHPLGSGGSWEVCRVYVRRDHRGTGLAHVLLDAAEARAVAGGAERLVLWTDTRFDAAHAFYEKRGYLRAGPIRSLDDASHSLEFRYAKPVRGLVVEALDAAAAASAERRLSLILVHCVAGGASVSFLPPLAPETAREHWRDVASGVARGERLLLAAWLDGQLVGTVQVVLATPPNQPHRAEVAKLLVEPAHRRRGVGQALMRRAEQVARDLGRRLLTLDTRAGDPAEPLYRALCWRKAGRIPGYALDEHGRAHDVLFFFKTLDGER